MEFNTTWLGSRIIDEIGEIGEIISRLVRIYAVLNTDDFEMTGAIEFL